MSSVLNELTKVQLHILERGLDADLCLFLSGEQICLIIYEMEKVKPYPVPTERLKTPMIIYTQCGKITGLWNGE